MPQTTTFIYLLHFAPLSPFPIDSWPGSRPLGIALCPQTYQNASS